jgi:hypothetical protein
MPLILIVIVVILVRVAGPAAPPQADPGGGHQCVTGFTPGKCAPVAIHCS